MDIDFQKRLMATFRDETREHLAAISDGLLALEKAADPEKRQVILEAVFREAHSLKGAARSVGQSGIESLSHALEGVFAGLGRREVPTSAALFDLLHRASDTISRLLTSGEPDRDTGGKIPVRELVLSLEQVFKGAPPTSPTSLTGLTGPTTDKQQEIPPVERSADSDTIRISAARLDTLLRQAEEMLTAKQAALQRAAELAEIVADLAGWEKEWNKIRPALRRLHKLQQATDGNPFKGADAGRMGKLLAYCEGSRDAHNSLKHKLHALAKARAGDRHEMELMVDGLVSDLKDVLLLPSATVLGLLPKMVRDLARERGKDVELLLAGEDVEIDKRILEQIKDPLIHLIRNCVDHGVEKPEERQRRIKPATGTIRVAVVLREANLVEIVVSDDGAGIDIGRVAAAAVRQGVVAQDQAGRMEMEDLLGLIFLSGLSTAPLITDISGRGLGMAIVREKVENLGGTVSVSSDAGQGTSFRMILPLTLSTCRGVLFAVGEQTFIVPSAGVERVARIDRSAFKSVENRESVELDGAALSFVRLSDVLRLPQKERITDDTGLVSLFVIGSGASRIAFGVDAVVDEQEILVKGLGPQLTRVRNIAGATLLGNGRMAAILHPGDLVRSALSTVAAGISAPVAKSDAPTRTSVLIAEDSITARTLLKNILESAGYRTTTAVDGMDALMLLRSNQIDLLVSDVDMPRMNGFELTAKIRASKDFSDLPVVLVTSLDAREDRERGIEVGANAYIVKSSFDQSNLVDVIKRLI
ncbi:MAG: hybrid sensor histidine kinase/response regulator [Desulfuromonadales bacterium]|nr:hybrid sensor histidine kinase/response regulator [Desulfuromonadales bacterium]